MAAGWTLAALLGLESLFALFPWAYAVLKTGGAAYLIWLAWKTWTAARNPLGQAAPARSRRAFLSGLLINFGNPKSVLFAGAVIVVIFPQGLAARDIALIVANHWMLELIAYTIFALLLGSAPARRGYLNLKPIFDRIAAGLLGALGLRLLLEK
jgi:threonine/homoserine/homoserine lactone efflux protein